MKEILLTGSEGMIGGLLYKGLAEKYDIHCLDRVESKKYKYFKADISEFSSLQSVFGKIEKVDCILHFAADKRIDAPWKSVVKNNIQGTKNIYESARLHKVKKVVLASSNQVVKGYFKEVADTPKVIKTEDPVRPMSYYAVGKVFSEALAKMYFDKWGIGSIILRIGTVLPDNNPIKKGKALKRWLSHDDLVQIVEKSVETKVKFGTYFAVSNNTGNLLDISNAKKDLGYNPQDNSSDHL